MKVYGIDFTSRPSRAKPITCLECVLEGTRLEARESFEWRDFDAFEAALREPGPWIAGLDFPFGLARRFIENIGWPGSWQGYVEYAKTLGREGFRAALDAYRQKRPPGDREHRRKADIAAGAISPQKIYGTPVGLMFFEGAPRLRSAGVTIPGLQHGDPERIVLETYPGILARSLIGRRTYKHDTKSKQSPEQFEARTQILQSIVSAEAKPLWGFNVAAPMSLAEDPQGDHLDALLCAIQAGWAWTQRDQGFGIPSDADPFEGWIAGPALSSTAPDHRENSANRRIR
jgi:Protein of unknown function (DUF429)